jgi:hypothetical protein
MGVSAQTDSHQMEPELWRAGLPNPWESLGEAYYLEASTTFYVMGL